MSRLPSPGALVVSSGRQPPATTEGEQTVDRDEDEEIDFLTIQEAAALLRIPVATLRWWRSQDIGPPSLKSGRHVRYPKRALQRWIEDQGRPGGDHAA